MADTTLSTGLGHPGALHAIGHAIAEMFARLRWQRFQLESATLNDHLLADIGIRRGDISSASSEHEFMARRDVFVPRHNLG